MKETILVVDDSEEIRAMFREFFDPLHYNVIEASDGAQGFMLADAELPDLIIMDIVMGGVFGTCATHRLQENRRTVGIPIILISGHSKGPELAWELAEQYPNIRFLKKPLELARLSRIVLEVLPFGGRRVNFGLLPNGTHPAIARV